MKRTNVSSNSNKKGNVVNVPVGFVCSSLLWGSYLCSSILIDEISKPIDMNKVAKFIGASTLTSLIGIPITMTALKVEDKKLPVDLLEVKNKIKLPANVTIKVCKKLHHKIYDMHR